MRRLLCNRRKAEWEGGDMSNKTTTTPRRGEWRWRPPLRLRKYLLHRMFGVRFLRMKSSEDIPSHPPTEREREGRKHICHERFREEGRKLWGEEGRRRRKRQLFSSLPALHPRPTSQDANFPPFSSFAADSAPPPPPPPPPFHLKADMYVRIDDGGGAFQKRKRKEEEKKRESFSFPPPRKIFGSTEERRRCVYAMFNPPFSSVQVISCGPFFLFLFFAAAHLLSFSFLCGGTAKVMKGRMENKADFIKTTDPRGILSVLGALPC